jgi:hypothetical protein
MLSSEDKENNNDNDEQEKDDDAVDPIGNRAETILPKE